MSYRRIFFWRYLAVGMILVLAFGPVAGGIGLVLAYWPVLWSAKRAAHKVDLELNARIIERAERSRSRQPIDVPKDPPAGWQFERRGDALTLVRSDD